MMKAMGAAEDKQSCIVEAVAHVLRAVVPWYTQLVLRLLATESDMTLTGRFSWLAALLVVLSACAETEQGAGQSPGPGADVSAGVDGSPDEDASSDAATSPDQTESADAGLPDPDAGDVAGLDGESLPDALGDAGPPTAVDPGRVTIHRLNRSEYNNTVRDLLGTDRRPANDFPDDDHGYGFDNVADVLTTTPTHVEQYLAAAELLVADLFYQPVVEQTSIDVDASLLIGTTGRAESGAGWLLWSNGFLEETTEIGISGRWMLQVRAGGTSAAGVAPEVVVEVDGSVVLTESISAPSDAPEEIAVELELGAGPHVVTVRFTNDYYDPGLGQDRNLFVAGWTLTGPIGLPAAPNPQREEWLTCSLTDEAASGCAREILQRFTTLAWRRPADSDAIGRLHVMMDTLVAEGDSWEQALQTAMTAVLVSPRFVYRPETTLAVNGDAAGPLDQWEIASRLSYFLWSSMPDQELFDLAAAGQLTDPTVLDAQVRRMLGDPRAESLVENFAGQWLYIRAVEKVQPDPEVFPSFTDSLRDAMVAEMQHFFRQFIATEIPLTELLTSDAVFVNAELAEFYGISGSFSETFERVVEPSGQRGGLLAQAGILTALSYPHRTSPVRRGKWVLGNLLCQEPAPPPAGVEGLPETGSTGDLSLRERMEVHRSDPTCAACHVSMDPIGLGLENFNAIGQWRDEDSSGPIDASGLLPADLAFVGHEDLASLIADDPAFHRCVTRQLLTYALGRGISTADTPWMRDIRIDYLDAGASFADLASAIVRSDIFLNRGAAVTGGAP